MAYATVADAELLYGVGYVTVACDRNVDGTLDTTSFEYQLQVASDQMDGFILGRYPLPLATPPAVFVKVCVDLAIYNSCPTADVMTSLIEKRNEQALHYMRDIAANRVKLVIAPNTTAPNESRQVETVTQPTVRRTLVQGSREFKTSPLRDLLSGAGGGSGRSGFCDDD